MISMIYHYPGKIATQTRSGSEVRPQQMLQAFINLGYEVFAVTGTSTERKNLICNLKKDILHGKHYDFMYCENRNIPLALSDEDHWPRHPRIDHELFSFIHQQKIPIGVFIRDIYWAFDDLYAQKVAYWKQLITRIFLRKDMHTYVSTRCHLFLPTIQVLEYLPSSVAQLSASELPPGLRPCIKKQTPNAEKKSPLRIMYIGGVTPPIYDLRPLLATLQKIPYVKLTICCRAEEYNQTPYLLQETNESVSIVHYYGDAVETLYDSHDYCIASYGDHTYVDFAMPIKFFEAIGHGLPFILFGPRGKGIRNFITKNGVGFYATNEKDLENLFYQLYNMPSQNYEKLRSQIEDIASRNTWLNRAHEVVRCLTGKELAT